jgi:hypothetical protein
MAQLTGLLPMGWLGFGHIGERGFAHYFQSCLMNAPEQKSRPTRLLVRAVFTTGIGSLAQAGKWRNWTIDGAHHGEEIDICRFVDQFMPTPFPDLAANDAAIAQLEQDELKEFIGDVLLRGD